MRPQGGRPLGEIETWIFDLDNTLYPASCRLFDLIDVRMTRYIAERLALSPEDAFALQKRYYREHGATLLGLMQGHAIDPHDFLDFVHEIELGGVPADPALVEALAALPGRKIIHTNGPLRHAERLVAHLGIADAFTGIVDIASSGFAPKPALDGYRALLRHHAVAPRTAIMVEDLAHNLEPAAGLGMTTAWLRPAGARLIPDEPAPPYIHYVFAELSTFLRSAVSQGSVISNQNCC